jgi:hypothetical protein
LPAARMTPINAAPDEARLIGRTLSGPAPRGNGAATAPRPGRRGRRPRAAQLAAGR